MIHFVLGHHSAVSVDTAAAAAKAVVACPDGNDMNSPPLNPRPNLKLRGFVSAEAYGRSRPSTPLRIPAIVAPTTSASVPWRPRSAARGICARRPTTYIDPPMRYGPE